MMNGESNGEMNHPRIDNPRSEAIDFEKAQRGTRLVLEAVGLDTEETELRDTWERRVPQTIATLTEGDRDGAKPTIRTFRAEGAGPVIKTRIPLYSLCEQHILPYHGVANVAYIPDQEIVGLSKLPRYVRWRSRRLTMQESLTNDIATGLKEGIDANGVVVEVTATHLCEAMRGVERATETTTRALAGDVPEPVVR